MTKLVAVAQPIVDLIVPVSPSFLESEGLEKSSYAMVSETEQKRLLAAISESSTSSSVGGSATNSIVTASNLGIKTAIIGAIGNDSHAEKLLSSLEDFSIKMITPSELLGSTGTCLSLVTPDGERTMRTNLGVATSLRPEHLCAQSISESDWLLLEGYLLTASEENRAALYEAIRIAQKNNTKIAFTASAEFVIETRRQEIINELLPHVDLLFANQGEALVLTQEASVDEALEALKHRCRGAVITCGAQGACGFTERE